MKSYISLILAGAFALILASCGGGPSGDKVVSSEAKAKSSDSEGVVYTVQSDKSIVEWEGAKLTYGHNGLISIQNGEVIMDGDQIKGGSFTIDMNSIVCLDIEDEAKNADLVNHLKSADFFEVETYPTAGFEITSAEKKGENMYSLTGNLTMKETTRSITFDAEVVADGEMLSATTPQFVIDRSEWNVRFGSKSFFDDLKDDFIKDEIGLVVKLTARK